MIQQDETTELDVDFMVDNDFLSEDESTVEGAEEIARIIPESNIDEAQMIEHLAEQKRKEDGISYTLSCQTCHLVGKVNSYSFVLLVM